MYIRSIIGQKNAYEIFILAFIDIKNPESKFSWGNTCTVEPLYNDVLGTMKITLLYQVSHYIKIKKQKYKELGPAKLPSYKRILLYPTSL